MYDLRTLERLNAEQETRELERRDGILARAIARGEYDILREVLDQREPQ